VHDELDAEVDLLGEPVHEREQPEEVDLAHGDVREGQVQADVLRALLGQHGA